MESNQQVDFVFVTCPQCGTVRRNGHCWQCVELGYRAPESDVYLPHGQNFSATFQADVVAPMDAFYTDSLRPE